MASCGGCSSEWSGLRMAHCASCHETFSTLGNFDLHITKSFEHINPSEVGLTQNSRGTWLMPGERDVSDLSKEKK